jgi:hypothetical protein
MARTQIILKGPLFDGQASAAANRYVETLMDFVAQEAENRLHVRLGEVLQHPTGYYEGHIHTDRASTERWVSAEPVIYSPWLEGTSSRNRKTRFKGYRTFRLIAQQLNADAETIAIRLLIVGGFLAEMGGVTL